MEEKGEQRAKCDPNGRAKAGRKWKDYILGAEPPGETEIRGQSWSLNGGRSGGGAGRVDRLGGLKVHLLWEREPPIPRYDP